MNLLVSGGLGFIGSNFIDMVLTSRGGAKVVNVDNLSHGASLASLVHHKKNPRYVFVEGDINNEDLISRHVSRSDAVVNFAAQSHVDRSISNPRPFLRSNTQGVFVMLEALRKATNDVELIQVSTDEVYGDIAVGSASEEAPLIPSSPYAASKAAAEMLCLAYHRTYGLKVKVTRCVNNFGPRQLPEKFLPKTIIRAHRGLRVPLYGNGQNIRDWIYVEDHCDALMTILRKGMDGEIYNISGHNEMKNIDVVKSILDFMGKPHILIENVEDRPGHDMRYSISDKKLRTELDWEPKHSFGPALAATVSWYLSNEEWWMPLADGAALSSSPWKTGR